MLTLNQGGELAFLGLTVYNSSSQSGSISKCLMTIYIYDNTIPYSGTGPINNPVLGVWQLPWDFPAYSGGALAPGAQKLLVWDFNGVGLVLPQNILITQQFTITQGTSTRNGIVLCNASPTGSSPNNFYFGSSAFTEGIYCRRQQPARLPGGHNPDHRRNQQSAGREFPKRHPDAGQRRITLTGSDPDSDPLTFNVATQPTHGFLSGRPESHLPARLGLCGQR